MDLTIRVLADKQKLSFLDFTTIHLYNPWEYDKILIKPFFSSDWGGLYKYMVFSSDMFNYEYIPIIQDTVAVPEKFIKAPGVAIHIIGKENQEEIYNYRLPTNFIKIGMGDVRCQL